jgi:hypothetical protein
MVPNTPIRSEKDITERKSGICQIVLPFRDCEVMLSGIFKNSRVCGTPFPTGQNIYKQHCKVASCEYILTNKTFPIAITGHPIRQNPGVEVSAINCTATVPKIRIQLRVLFDFIRCFIGRKMDMFAIEPAN